MFNNIEIEIVNFDATVVQFKPWWNIPKNYSFQFSANFRGTIVQLKICECLNLARVGGEARAAGPSLYPTHIMAETQHPNIYKHILTLNIRRFQLAFAVDFQFIVLIKNLVLGLSDFWGVIVNKKGELTLLKGKEVMSLVRALQSWSAVPSDNYVFKII